MIRMPLAAALCAAVALPATAQSVIENEQMVVYEKQWVQTKLPQQNGALLFLNVPRGQKGEYFSIACERTGGGIDRTVKLGYPEPLPAKKVKLTMEIDGEPVQAIATSTGTTRDDTYTKSDIHGYALSFPSEADEAAFFDAMRAGETLRVGGQTIPVDLTGFGAALAGQPDYCG